MFGIARARNDRGLAALWLFLGGTCLLVCASITPALADSESSPKVAVMPIKDDSEKLSRETLKTATTYLRNSIAATDGVIVVEKNRQDAKLDDIIARKKKQSYESCYDESCQIPLGRALAADTILRSRITYFGKCVLSVQLVDLAKEATIKGAQHEFQCSSDGLKSAIDATRQTIFRGGHQSDQKSNWRGKIGEKSNWSPGDLQKTTVTFKTEPEGAAILVDGRVLCKSTPCSKLVTLGQHRISVQKQRYFANNREVSISEKNNAFHWQLEPRFGLLSVTSTPEELAVFVDGNKIGTTPIQKHRVSPGNRAIKIEDACFQTVGRKIGVEAGESKSFRFEPEPVPSAIEVMTRDPDGNAVEARAFVDGEPLGRVPGRFKVPVCSETLVIKSSEFGTAEKALDLEREQVSKIKVKLGSSWGGTAQATGWGQDDSPDASKKPARNLKFKLGGTYGTSSAGNVLFRAGETQRFDRRIGHQFGAVFEMDYELHRFFELGLLTGVEQYRLDHKDRLTAGHLNVVPRAKYGVPESPYTFYVTSPAGLTVAEGFGGDGFYVDPVTAWNASGYVGVEYDVGDSFGFFTEGGYKYRTFPYSGKVGSPSGTQSKRPIDTYRISYGTAALRAGVVF